MIPSVSAADVSNDTLTDDGDDKAVLDDGDSIERKDVVLVAEDKTWIYGLDAELNVNVHDSEGNNVTGGVLTFENVFNRNYTVNVSDGLAAGEVRCAGIGLINITCRYTGNEYYNNASTVLHLNIPLTNTTCQNILATRYNDTVYFTGNMVCDYRQYDQDIFDEYEEVTEGTLEIFIDGEKLGTCDVDLNGNFVFIWKTTRNLIGQTINFTAFYKHKNNCFNPSNFSKNFTFSAPKDTDIITNVDVLDTGDILITGSVYDSFGNKVVGGFIIYNNTPIAVDTNGNFKFYLTHQSIPEAQYEIGFMDWGSKADITANVPLMNDITHNPITNTKLTEDIIDLCKNGTPYIKFGNGEGKPIVMVAGTHGGELAPQLAAFELINLLANYGGNINKTIYIIPVLFPQATANNTRVFNHTNPNSVANENGSISNSVVKFALSVNASGLGDFHSTRHSNTDVGITCVMCTLSPTYESFLIADFIHNQTGYKNKVYDIAGDPYDGAIEDNCNMRGLPAVTCEVLTNHRAIEYGSPEMSFNHMRAFLKYFGVDTDDLIKLPFSSENLNLTFISPYNYNSSSLLITRNVTLVGDEIIGIYGYDFDLNVQVMDSLGNNITGGKMTFENVFGQNYTVDVHDGVAECTVHASEIGMLNITCRYSGNEFYNNATTVFSVNIPLTNTTCRNIVATRYNNTVYFTGNMLCDFSPYVHFDNFQEVTEGTLEVYVDGERLGTCNVTVNGNFVFIWNTTRNLIGQTINFTAFYKDEKNCYNPSNFSKNFTFPAPKDTNIITHVDILDAGEILITGSVYDSSGNKVVGGQITYNNIAIAVDTNGNFKFYLTSQPIPEAEYEIGFMDWGSKADITANVPLMNAIVHTQLSDKIIDLCKNGTPYLKFGNGKGKTVVMVAGTHGDELAPQVAAFNLVNLLAQYGSNIDGTIYVFPVLFPQATAINSREFNGTNLNRVANQNGTVSNSLIKFALSVNASGIGDFHSTRHGDDDVGITCVMGSRFPDYESFLIADFIHNQTGYAEEVYDVAGNPPYDGAIEDFSNINGIPAVTCEVLTNHRAVEYGSPEVSFNHMRAFLKYFGVETDNMIKVPFTNEDVSLIFTSPYNYNQSSVLISNSLFKKSAQITANPASFIINYGGKYSITLKDASGKVIAGKTVIFTLNGKNIASVKTDSKGVATVKLTSGILKTAKAGNKNMIVKFNGDAGYNSVSKTVKITVNKEKTRIVSSKKTFKTSQKVKKYSIVLKNSKGKAVKKQKVTLKINGKTFKATTNSKGKAIFKIKLFKKGTFTAKIKYAGSKYFNGVSKNVKIKIR